MKHAREDYNRIQDPDGKIPEDEPVFLFRAQDELAWEAIAYYAYLCRQKGLNTIARVSDDHAVEMRKWPIHKLPDL